MPKKRKPDKRIFFRTMEDALTARNNANESVKNVSEVKQALLKKRRRTSTKFRDKRCGIEFYEDDVTYYGLRCKFCCSQTEAYAGPLVDKDDGHLVFGSVSKLNDLSSRLLSKETVSGRNPENVTRHFSPCLHFILLVTIKSG